MNKNTKYTQINTNKSMRSELGPVWQKPFQRTGSKWLLRKPALHKLTSASAVSSMPLCLCLAAAADWLPGTCRWCSQIDHFSL